MHMYTCYNMYYEIKFGMKLYCIIQKQQLQHSFVFLGFILMQCITLSSTFFCESLFVGQFKFNLLTLQQHCSLTMSFLLLVQVKNVLTL